MNFDVAAGKDAANFNYLVYCWVAQSILVYHNVFVVLQICKLTSEAAKISVK